MTVKTSDTKKQERERIEADVRKYLESGGRIDAKGAGDFGKKFSYETGVYQSGLKYVKPTGAKLDYNKSLGPQ